MKKLIFSKVVNPQEGKPKKFALWPTIVHEAAPNHEFHWLVWLEWYEVDLGEKWLIRG